jgi:hypothetical protein
VPALPDSPQHRLYFLPLPHGQGAFLEGLLWVLLAGIGRPPGMFGALDYRPLPGVMAVRSMQMLYGCWYIGKRLDWNPIFEQQAVMHNVCLPALQ